jgi:plasmid stabilization system protein ParE
VGRESPCRQNPLAAEFQAAVERLAIQPACGLTYQLSDKPGVRRLLLPRSRYHVYYEVDDANRVVTILAIWHAMRGQGPRLF